MILAGGGLPFKSSHGHRQLTLAVALSLALHAGLALAIALSGGWTSSAPRRIASVIDLVDFPVVAAEPEPVLPSGPPEPAPALQAAEPAQPEAAPAPNPAPLPEEAAAGAGTGEAAPISPEMAPDAAIDPLASGPVIAVPGPGGGGHGTGGGGGGEDFLPQYKVTEIPVVPVAEVLSRIQYPPLAARQGMEATVYLELYIDRGGKIVRITVLKDPGFGFAEAAIAALSGLTCSPAMAGGVPVAVRFRYPVRFTLK